jgi:hypothetical protein
MKSKVDTKSYIFLDESGKPEVYSVKGTNLVTAGTASKYLVIAAVRTTDHLALQQEVTACRLALLKDKSLTKTFSPNYALNAFHAQTDYPSVRKRFCEWIRDSSLDLKISVIIANKLKAYPQLQRDSGRFYATLAGQLLKRFLHTAEDVEVIFSRRDSSLKTRERVNLVVDTIRLHFAQDHTLEPKTEVRYYHNPHYTHGGLQIADYVAYAVFQVFERRERQWYDIIKHRIGYIQDIFNKKSYSRSNPL